MIESTLKYIGTNSADIWNTPTKDDLIEDSTDEALVWYHVDSFRKRQSQSEEFSH